MIRLVIQDGKVLSALGLTPGDDIHLLLDGRELIIHRHGEACHVHECEERSPT